LISLCIDFVFQVAYDELVIDLGYMILFAGAAPAVPLLMIPLTLIRKWLGQFSA
jgi:hypothetical protein